MKLSNFKNTSGPGYIILQIIRVCNIICLLSCLASSSVMLVKTFVVSKFFFFDATSHIITGILAILLILTETSLFRKWFMHNWPLLSVSAGFVTLGLLMLALGTLILGNLNKEATSEDSLGTSCWRLLIASGIITSAFGIINIIANYLFRKVKLGITARMVRAFGATAGQHVVDIYGSGPRGEDMYNQWHAKTLVPSHQSSFTNLKHSDSVNSNSHGSRQGAFPVAPTTPPPRPASTVPSYYASTEANRSAPSMMSKKPSIIMSELGGPGARSVSPLSSRSSTTRWPAGRSVSSPTKTMKYGQYEFDAGGVKKPEAVHPAYRNDGANGGGWV